MLGFEQRNCAYLDVCAPGIIVGICEAFHTEGTELFSRELEDAIAQGMIGLPGETDVTEVGTCGAVSVRCFFISRVMDVTLGEFMKDVNRNYATTAPICEYVVDRLRMDYRAIDCLRLRYNRVQRPFDQLGPDPRIWEMLFGPREKQNCGALMEYGGAADNHPMVRRSRYAAEVIPDLPSVAPTDREQVPPIFAFCGRRKSCPRFRRSPTN